MKTLKTVLFLLTIILSVISCKKDDNHLGNRKFTEIQLWSYNISSEGNYFIEDRVPAIDENDNIYVNFFNDINSGDDVYSFSKDGQLKWTKKSDGFICSKIAYKSNKIFFITHIGDADNQINCLNSTSGEPEWTSNFVASCDDRAFAITDDALLYAVSDSLFKYDLSGNLIAKIKIGNSLSDQYVSMSVFNHDIYILAQMGNTFVTHLIKCSENSAVLTKDWEELFSTDNTGSGIYETNFSVDLSINNSGDVTVLSTSGLYSYDKDGNLKWKNTKILNSDNSKSSNASAYSSTTITDSGFVLIGFKQMYKLNSEGKIVANTENDFDSFELTRAPLIASDGRYYTVSSGSSMGAGIRALNSDASQYWYTILPPCYDVPAMMHNGNLVFISDGILYCAKTDAGGLDENAQWPKIYYDYGNTGFKKN